ncbi:MAG: aminopeptidase [Patescibacteria group bacterium]
MSYIPSEEVLNKYADVLINFALGSEKGIKKGDVVFLQVPECARPILVPLRNAVLKAGGHPIIQYLPDSMTREFFELASPAQLDFFPAKYLKGKVDEADHNLLILAEEDPHELEGIDPAKIMRTSRAFKPYKDWRIQKEIEGKFTWVLALYGTPAMAKEAKMSLEEYWNEIINACYLDEDDPKTTWVEISNKISKIKNKLNKLEIEHLHILSENTDLIVALGSDRQWLSGGGRNIPSFEIFTSPDWRGTQGHITFTEPLYIYGNLVENVYLEFENGIVQNAKATKGEKFLHEMLKVEHANKIGEFSLTDSSLSRITKFMGHTLFDENVGGKYGNTHIALGSSFKETYKGDSKKVSDEEWELMGFNNSAVHTDIVSTENRKVVATLLNGSELVIYENGHFTL